MRPIKYSDLEQSETIHIFEYYDFPLFFILKSPNNELFLNYYIEEIEKNTDKWLFSRITDQELNNLIQQRLSVLNLLERLLEKKRLYHLYVDSKFNDSGVEANLELIETSNFDPESFPEEDFFVEYDYVSKRKLTKVQQDLIESSMFKIVLKDKLNSHDISLNLLLELLNKLKLSINDIAYDIGNKLIGQNADYEINLRVDSLQPSSFGIWLKTEPQEADLFEIPEKSINNFFNLIKDIQIKDKIELEDQIHLDEQYSVETIKSVNSMLKDIVENEFSFSLEAKSKENNTKKEVKFDKESYNKLDILTQILKENSEEYTEEIEIEGILTSINTTYNKFRISTTSIGDISGKMSKEIFKKIKSDKNLQFRVPSLIKATVMKEVINNYVEDEYTVKYTLKDFEQPDLS